MEKIQIKKNSLSNRLYEEVELNSKRNLQSILDWVDKFKKESPRAGLQSLNFKFLQEEDYMRNGAVVSSIPPYGCMPYLEVWEDEITLFNNHPRPLENGWYTMNNSTLHFFLCKKEDTVLFVTF